MCNCNGSSSSSMTLLQGATGATGATGTPGSDGIYGGYSSTWLFSTSTASGPTSTLLRLNHGTYSIVSAIHVADENSEATDLNDFLNSLDNGGNFGLVRIFKEDDADVFWYGILTAVTDNTTDFTLTVTYVLHNGSFAANDRLVLTFSPSGADGAAGASGTNGQDGGVILYNDFSNSRTGIRSVANGGAGTSGALETVNTYSAVIPGGTMATDDDEIIISGLITNNEASNNEKWFLSVDGTNNLLTGNTDGYAFSTEFPGGVGFTMSITRISSSQAWATMEFWYIGAASSPGSGLADVSLGSTISFFAESPLLSVAWQTDKDIIIKIDSDAASATQEIKSILNVKYFHKI